MVESKSHAQRPVGRWRTACLAAQSLRVAGGCNVQAWRSVLRRPAHRRASAAGAAPRSRWAVRPLAASAPQCLGQQVNASACAVCGVSQSTSIRHRTHLSVCPGPASTQRLRCICCFATAGIGHAAHAGGCFVSACRVRTSVESRGVASAVLSAQAWPAVTANPSIERTPYGAAHVERYASAAVHCLSNVGLFGGLRAQSAAWPALRMSASLSVLGQFAPRLVRSAALFAQGGAYSQVQATQTPRRESALCEPSLACAPRRGCHAAQRRSHAPVRARTHRRSNTAAQGWAGAGVRGMSRTQNALHRAPSRPQGSIRFCASRPSGASGPGSHNPSIERTSKRLRLFAAAHVER
jgi:hypothetical protein